MLDKGLEEFILFKLADMKRSALMPYVLELVNKCPDETRFWNQERINHLREYPEDNGQFGGPLKRTMK